MVEVSATPFRFPTERRGCPHVWKAADDAAKITTRSIGKAKFLKYKPRLLNMVMMHWRFLPQGGCLFWQKSQG
eukprot:758376-Rhodomonas_salina.1